MNTATLLNGQTIPVPASQIKRWTMAVVSEQAIVQRCYNAARWYEQVVSQNG